MGRFFLNVCLDCLCKPFLNVGHPLGVYADSGYPHIRHLNNPCCLCTIPSLPSIALTCSHTNTLQVTRTPAEGGLALAKLAVEHLPAPAPMPDHVRRHLAGAEPEGAGYYRLRKDNSGLDAVPSSDVSYNAELAAGVWAYVEACRRDLAW
jgi:hypothetical protein